MKVKELIAALSDEHVDPEAEVVVDSDDDEGNYGALCVPVIYCFDNERDANTKSFELVVSTNDLVECMAANGAID